MQYFLQLNKLLYYLNDEKRITVKTIRNVINIPTSKILLKMQRNKY